VFGFAYGGIMPLYAILVREQFGAPIMGAVLGAVGFTSTLGMAAGPPGGRLHGSFGSYSWPFIASSAMGASCGFAHNEYSLHWKGGTRCDP
jgi:MFS family permease